MRSETRNIGQPTRLDGREGGVDHIRGIRRGVKRVIERGILRSLSFQPLWSFDGRQSSSSSLWGRFGAYIAFAVVVESPLYTLPSRWPAVFFVSTRRLRHKARLPLLTEPKDTAAVHRESRKRRLATRGIERQSRRRGAMEGWGGRVRIGEKGRQGNGGGS